MAWLPLKIVLVIVSELAKLTRPPPHASPTTGLGSRPPTLSPWSPPLARLSVNVLLAMVSGPALAMAPPRASPPNSAVELLAPLAPTASLPVNVQLLMASDGRGEGFVLAGADGAAVGGAASASLPLNVELVMVPAELLLMAPPLPSPVPVAGPTAWLLENALLVTVSEGP